MAVTALRAHWNGSQRKFLGFFLAQAMMVVLFAVPFLAAASNPRTGWSVWTSIAIAVWLIAVGGEALADRQLSAHKANLPMAARPAAPVYGGTRATPITF